MLPEKPPFAGPDSSPSSAIGLGLDAGGTETRWALARADGSLLAEGAVAAISGLALTQEDARAQLAQPLQELAAALAAALQAAQAPVQASAKGPAQQSAQGSAQDSAPHPQALVAGLTGFDPASTALWCELASTALKLPVAAIRVLSDIELACHAAFAPGQGIVVYAGTGSIAAHLDANGQLQRCGGRGAIIDDAGGGHWIARQALQQIWRGEDEAPGRWQCSAMARRVFAQIGGSDWAHSRAWVYGASRGELGLLALAVAAAADEDPAAMALLQSAGQELGRLARALLGRLGHLSPQPVALAGRVFDLHPAVEAALRVNLGPHIQAQRLTQAPQHAAARLAARLIRCP